MPVDNQDRNFVNSDGGLTAFGVADDGSNRVLPLRIDPVTGELLANAVVSGTVTANPPLDVVQTTTFTSGGQTNQFLGGLDGYAGWEVYLTGTFSGGTTILFEGTTDGTHWFSTSGRMRPGMTQYGSVTGTIGGSGAYDGVIGSMYGFRVRVLSFSAGDSITCTVRISQAFSTVFSINQTVGCTKIQTNQVAVSTTVSQLDSTPLAKRRAVEIYSIAGNTNNTTIWVGFSNSVTPSTGRGISNGEAWRLDVDESVQIWAVASNAATASLTEIGQ